MCKGVQTCPFYIVGNDFIFQTPQNPISQVNFTYIDLPEEGLSLSEGDSYDFFSPSNQYSFSVSHSSDGYINMEVKNNSTSSSIYSTSIFVENETVNLKIIKQLRSSTTYYYLVIETGKSEYWKEEIYFSDNSSETVFLAIDDDGNFYSSTLLNNACNGSVVSTPSPFNYSYIVENNNNEGSVNSPNTYPSYLYIQNNQDNPLVIPFHSEFNFVFNTSIPSPYLSSSSTPCNNGVSNLTIPSGGAAQVVFNYVPNVDNTFPTASVFLLTNGIPSTQSPIRWFQYIDYPLGPDTVEQYFTNIPGCSNYDNKNIVLYSTIPATSSSDGSMVMELALQSMSSSIFVFYNNSNNYAPTYYTTSSCEKSLNIEILNDKGDKTFPYLVFIIPFVLANEDGTTYVDYIPYTIQNTSVKSGGIITISIPLNGLNEP